LLSEGNDPMAVRLAVISHHYRADWDWTADSLLIATERLAIWRTAVGASSDVGGSAVHGEDAEAGMRVLATVRNRMADDLDSPGAIAAVDEWAAAALAGEAHGSGPVVRDAVDALLGVAL
jgi:L-cysteine:1D-myo-inositol 2-amino-2-deoxy-alpha-D-glucopyranoside ligase